jgi:hypothetical protein
MPITPSSYHTNFPITAHQLNQDLYTYDGSYFNTNGVAFHSNRPLMSESYQVASVVLAAKNGSLTVLGGTQGDAISILDNAALFGLGADYPGNFATFWSVGAISPGSAGAAGIYGGWTWLCTFLPVGPFTGTASTYGNVWSLGVAGTNQGLGTPLQDIGCMQPGSATQNNCGFALDLVERISSSATPVQIYAPVTFLVDPAGSSNAVVANTSSSTGQTPRFVEIWMGVTPPYGNTVSTIPVPIPSVGTATTFSSSTLNTTINQTFNLLNNPPMLNVQLQNTNAITANAVTTVPFTTTPVLDNYSGFSTASQHYIVPLSGMYLLHANIIYNIGWNIGSGYVGFNINGNTVSGGSYNATPNSAINTGISATKVLSLNQGDTVSVFTQLNASTDFGNGNISRFLMGWMAPINTTTQSWTPPDVTGFQFAAGNPPGTGTGNLVTLMNTKIANDINFLLNRPYCSVHQTTAQTGLANTTWTSILMQSTVTQIHGDLQDNYNGWNAGSNHYVAPVNGWYLAVEEISCATTSTANSHFQVLAGFSVPTSGGFTAPSTPDVYQQIQVSFSGTWPSATTGMGLYYLLAGETIAPVGKYIGGTWATSVANNVASHFNVFWMSN